MYAEERQRAFLDRARTQGRVDVAGLAAEFSVTTETIRRDLTVLEQHGLLRRVHGGAIPVERLVMGPARAATRTADTRVPGRERGTGRIVKAALAELPACGAILLDADVATAQLAERLPTDRELTVVTNSLTIALTLATRPNLTLMLIGGRLRGRSLAAVDSWALQSLRDTYVDVAFLAADGVSVARGLTTQDPAEALVKRAAIAAARRTVLLADHTRMDDNHFARFGDVADVDTVVTDTGIDPRVAQELTAAGPRVVIA